MGEKAEPLVEEGQEESVRNSITRPRRLKERQTAAS